MEHHDCTPPAEPRRLDAAPTWTCPECGDVWRVAPHLPIDPPQEYDIATARHHSPAEWIRVGREGHTA